MKQETTDYLKKEMGSVHDAFQTLDKYNPKLAEAVVSLRKLTVSGGDDIESALASKYKELIMVAIEVATGRGEKGKTHAQKAIRAGATPDEVLDALGLCIYLVGKSSWVDGGHACLIAAVDEMKKLNQGKEFQWGSSAPREQKTTSRKN